MDITDKKDMSSVRLNVSKDVCTFPHRVIRFKKFIRRGPKSPNSHNWWFEGSLKDKDFGSVPVAMETMDKVAGKGCSRGEEEFLYKAEILSKLSHENVVRFIGVYLEHSPPCVISELFTDGDLLRLIQVARYDTGSSPHLSLANQVQISIDIARGCLYLQQQRIIHMDITAANCFIVNKTNKRRVVKIGEFHLAIVLPEGNDYYEQPRVGVPVNIRRSAPEIFAKEKLSVHVDQWSYGTVLFEIFSFGGPLYPDMTDDDVMKFIRGGVRPNKPDKCPANVYKIMQSCWKLIPSSRMPFEEILHIFIKNLQTLQENQFNEPQHPFSPSSLIVSTSNLKHDLLKKFKRSIDDINNSHGLSNFLAGNVTTANSMLSDLFTGGGSTPADSNSSDFDEYSIMDLDSIYSLLVEKYMHTPVERSIISKYKDENGKEMSIRNVPMIYLDIEVDSIGSNEHGAFYEGKLENFYEGKLENCVGLPDGCLSIQVTVVTKKESSSITKAKFLKEVQIVSKFNHKNILKFYGACLECNPVRYIMELFKEDSLLNTIKQPSNKLSMADKIRIALDIAEACVYLHYQRVIHANIAAWNCYCIINQDSGLYTTKLGGFTNAIALPYEQDLFIIDADHNNDSLAFTYPIKWSAPECYQNNILTMDSDIWSYGITLTEIFSDGQVPYPGVTNVQVMDLIRIGKRMAKHDSFPLKIYNLMLSCWDINPTHRITFEEITKSLTRHLANIDKLDDISQPSELQRPPSPLLLPITNHSIPLPTSPVLIMAAESSISNHDHPEHSNSRSGTSGGFSYNDGSILEDVDKPSNGYNEDSDSSLPTLDASGDEADINTKANILAIDKDLLTVKRKQISARLSVIKNRKARGIIFIVGVYGADGTEVDVENVEATFKELNFVTYIVQDPPAEEIAALIQAASDTELYPYRYQYVGFYFAGHGGRDENNKMFIVGLQKDDNKREILYVNDHIINPLKVLHQRKLSRLFFFDCCQSKSEGVAYRSPPKLKRKPKPNPGELIAYATNEGEKSWGDKKNGGIWTYHLCKNIRELNEPITTVLSKTYDDVVEARDSFQQPLVISQLGMRILKADDTTAQTCTDETECLPKGGGTNLKPVTVKEVCTALKDHFSYWNDFAFELELDDEFRDSLKENNSLSDEVKMERVIERWIEKGTPLSVSWERITTIANELDLKDAVLNLEQASKASLNPIVWRDVFNCLKRKASLWSDLAQELELKDSFQAELEQGGMNDRWKLEEVIREWVDEGNGYSPSWEKMISVVKKLELHDEAQKLMELSRN